MGCDQPDDQAKRYERVTFTCAVIGLGNIGQGYDYEVSDTSQVLTHSAAFHQHPGFRLIAGVDPDAAARSRFEAKFKQAAFSSVAELYASQVPDVVAICVPTALHNSVFADIVRRAPKAIVCEKPLASCVEDAETMVAAAERAGALLLVNYMRRFMPAFAKLKARIEAGEFGGFYKGLQWYSRGLLNNGSHFVDLLTFLFGPASDIEVMNEGRKLGEFDSEPDVRMRFGSMETYLLAARSECFTVFDLQLLGTLAEIRCHSGGESISIRKAQSHSFASGHKILEATPEIIETELRQYQWHVVQGLYDSLMTGRQPVSNGHTALDTIRTIQPMMARTAEVTHA